MKSDLVRFAGLTSHVWSPCVAARARRAALCGVVLLAFAACTSTTEDRIEEVRELQTNGDMDGSIPILVELIESGNRQGEILYRYGRALSLTGKWERSVWALDAARDDPEWFVPASQQLAMDAQRAGNYEFAIQVFERLHEEAPEELEGDLFALLLEARTLLDSQERFEQALELLDSILERFPEEETAIRMKAVALLALKRPDEAYDLLRASNVPPAGAASDETVGATAVRGADDESGKVADSGAVKADGADVATADADAADPGDSEIYLDLEDETREAYWCAVRTSFKREAGDIEEAMKIADECLERFPNDVDLISQAVKLYSEAERYETVLAILEKAYEKSPDDVQIRAALLQYLGRIGRTKDVEKILRKTVDDAVAEGRGATMETASHWVELAGFLMEHDRVGEALLAFDSANEIIGDEASPDLLLREAEALIRAKEYDEALAMAEKTPVEVHRYMLLGRIAFEQGDYSKALEELDRAALLWPDNGPIRYYRARAAEGVGDFDLAIEEYRQTMRSDSGLAAARERLATLHLAEGNVREAAAILTFQSPRDPSAPSTEMQILMVEVETLRGTEPDLDIAPTPEYPTEKVRAEAIRALGRGLQKRSNARVAAGVLAELEKASVPPIRGAFLRERVGLLIAADKPEEAVAEARKGLADRPKDPDSQLALGRALVASGLELDEAERLLRGVVEKRPEDVDAWTSLGDLEARRGDLAKANETYERVLGLRPEHWAAFAPRIEDLFESGKAEEALRRLEAFVAGTAPYDGRGALELARRLPEGDLERRIKLAKQAVRFGGGREAVELLAKLDPEAAPEGGSIPDESTVPEGLESAAEELSPVKAALPEKKGSPETRS